MASIMPICYNNLTTKSEGRYNFVKKVFFHQDNAPAHKSAILMPKIHEFGVELVPYSPIIQIWLTA